MKTYTFAEKDAPVREHMAGLVEALRIWRNDLHRQIDRAPNQRERAKLTGYVQAYDQIVGIIEDSTSIE